MVAGLQILSSGFLGSDFSPAEQVNYQIQGCKYGHNLLGVAPAI
jgi:hypothetical protein